MEVFPERIVHYATLRKCQWKTIVGDESYLYTKQNAARNDSCVRSS